MKMDWWTRFQMGSGVAGQATQLLLLSANLAPTLGKYLGCRALWPALLLPPLILAALTGIGWGLDAWGWNQRLDGQLRRRSPTWDEVFERLERIERRLER